MKTFVTGQQLGLLGGPLFTTYKVLGAVYHARENRGKAVYWLETNDADFNEINRIRYLDSRNELRTLKWDMDTSGFSCGNIPVDDQLIRILNVFFDTLIPTPHTEGLRKDAMDCYVSGRTLGEASVCLARKLFGGFELELFDPSVRAFRDFSRPLLLREAESTPEGGQCGLFYMDGPRRKALFKKNGKIIDREGNEVRLESFDLVPSLATRSVCQDAYFKTAAYIAGPAEAGYLNELGDRFAFHSVRPAAVIPRMSISLIEPSVRRDMARLNIGIRDVGLNDEETMKRKKVRELTGFDKEDLSRVTGDLSGEFLDGLEKAGLNTAAFRKTLRAELKEMIGKKRKEEKEKSESALRRVGRVYRHLMPFGQKQERIFNVFQYMNLYGGYGFIEFLYKKYDPSLTAMEIEND